MTSVRKYKSLLKQAKRIFGEDVVVNAWVTIDSGRLEDKVTISKLLDIEEQSVVSNESELDYDGATIILEFASERLVEFSNSEWACIRSVQRKELQEYD